MLKVAKRTKLAYKLCVLMFDVFHGTAPVYLTDLCSRSIATTVYD